MSTKISLSDVAKCAYHLQLEMEKIEREQLDVGEEIAVLFIKQQQLSKKFSALNARLKEVIGVKYDF